MTRASKSQPNSPLTPHPGFRWTNKKPEATPKVQEIPASPPRDAVTPCSDTGQRYDEDLVSSEEKVYTGDEQIGKDSSVCSKNGVIFKAKGSKMEHDPFKVETHTESSAKGPGFTDGANSSVATSVHPKPVIVISDITGGKSDRSVTFKDEQFSDDSRHSHSSSELLQSSSKGHGNLSFKSKSGIAGSSHVESGSESDQSTVFTDGQHSGDSSELSYSSSKSPAIYPDSHSDESIVFEQGRDSSNSNELLQTSAKHFSTKSPEKLDILPGSNSDDSIVFETGSSSEHSRSSSHKLHVILTDCPSDESDKQHSGDSEMSHSSKKGPILSSKTKEKLPLPYQVTEPVECDDPLCCGDAEDCGLYTSGVGTTIYAAPEQLNITNYDHKVSIHNYSTTRFAFSTGSQISGCSVAQGD